MNKIHALLTGINNYHPSSLVSSLQGCHSDLYQWRSFLENSFPKERLNIQALLDGDATYQNVVHHCGEAFLGRAKAGDTVLFVYSGHGSREGAAAAFDRYYPEGVEETIVLYDSRVSGGLDLADKELAVLIARMAQQGADVVVVLDCCHAGSGTRSAGDFTLGAARYQEERGNRRDLENYLDGALMASERAGKLYLPAARHILLAAADRKEKAWETTERSGLFTSCLMRVLDETGGRIPYTDLFARTRMAMLQVTDEQHPQFEPYGFFNGYGGFLGLGATATAGPLRVFFDRNDWQANVGAIHGLTRRGAELPAFELFKDGAPLGQVRAKSVGMEACTLLTDELPLQAGETYEAQLSSLPTPKVWYALDAPEKIATNILSKLREEFRPLSFDLQPHLPKAPYRMVVIAEEIKLIRAADGLVLRTISGNDEDKMYQDAFEKLEHIARWESLVDLDNPHTQLRRNEVELVFSELDGGGHVLRSSTDTDLTVDIDLTDGQEKPVPFRLEVRNHSGQKTRHCALFYASDAYGFLPVGYNEPVPAGANAVALEYDSNGERTCLMLNGKQESTDIFRLFVSNRPLTGENMELKAFELGKKEIYWRSRDAEPTPLVQTKGWSGNPSAQPLEDRSDWFALTLRIRCVAQEAQIHPERDVSLGEGTIRVKSHPKLGGRVGLVNAQAGSRSVDPLSIIVRLAQEQGLSLLPLMLAHRGAPTTANVLEITDLSHTAGLSEAAPLEIEIAAGLSYSTDQEELLLPLTFDGEHLIPVGEAQRLLNGDALVRISHLPDTTDTRRRSLGKALRLCFLKLVLKKDSVQYLRWVDYSGVRPERRAEGLRERVAAARRILVLIHGIIGDTKGICDFAAPLVQPTGEQPAPYDLVLTFDYENLNTPLQDTAGRLAELLREEAGILPDGEPRLTILAHSMGGLVARYFVQNLGGDKLLRHLVLAGTPNQGSAIARLTTYRDYAIPLLTLLVNLPWGIPAAASVLGLLEKSKDLTSTLAQMDWEQDSFLKNLQKGTLHGLPCSIVAGDLQQYLLKNTDKRKLMDKAFALGGRLFYGDTPNDLAVSVESIQSVPNAFGATVVACHHLGYFEDTASVRVMEDLLCGDI